jgi:hypothetical protein
MTRTVRPGPRSAKSARTRLHSQFSVADTRKVQGPCHVIRSSAFPVVPGEDTETNPGVFGRSLANYVAAQMRLRGWEVEGVIPEDFGYCVMLSRKPVVLWIGCGNRREKTDEWMAFVVAEGAIPKRVLRMLDPSKEIGRVSEVLGEIMKSAPGVEEYIVES